MEKHVDELLRKLTLLQRAKENPEDEDGFFLLQPISGHTDILDQAEYICSKIQNLWDGLVDPASPLVRKGIENSPDSLAGEMQASEILPSLQSQIESLARKGSWAEAERLCSTLTPKWKQVELLGYIGSIQAQRGDFEQARNLWAKAEQEATGCKLRWHQAKAYANLGAILAQAGNQEQAERLLTKAETVCASIKTKSPQTLGFFSVAMALLRMGKLEQARKLQVAAEQIYVSNAYEDNSSVSQVLKELCLTFAEAGFWEEAERICTTVMVAKSPSAEISKWDAQSKLAKMLADAGHWGKAEQISDAISSEWQRVQSLSYVGTVLSQMGKQEQARHLWKQVVQRCAMAPETNILGNNIIFELRPDQQHWRCFECVSAALAPNNFREEKEYVLHHIRQEWRQMWILSELATTLAQIGEWEEAHQVSRELPNEFQRTKVLGEVSMLLAQNGLWQEAEQICTAIEKIEAQVKYLIEIGRILVQAGKVEAAEFLWDRIERIYTKIEGEDNQYNIIVELGRELCKAQKWKEAQRIYLSISAQEKRDDALGELSLTMAQNGLWDDAEQTCLSINSRENQAYTYSELAQELSKRNEREQAEYLWEKAIQIAAAIPQRSEQALMLNQLGIARYQRGEEEQALRLWKKAEQVCTTIRKKREQWEALESLSMTLGDLGEKLVGDATWQKAEFVFTMIPNRVVYSGHISLLVEKLMSLGHAEMALDIWDRAYLHCQSTPDSGDRFYALHTLGTSICMIGEQKRSEQALKEAADTLMGIYDNKEKIVFLDVEEIQQDLAKAGLWDKAARVCEKVSKQKVLAGYLDKLGEAFTRGASWQEIEAACANIPDESLQHQAYRQLTDLLMQVGEQKEAERIGSAIKDK